MSSTTHNEKGAFTRPDSVFRDAISSDPGAKFPAEAGRYAIYFSPVCPWAHRTIIVRILKGLESFIDTYQLSNEMGPDGWFFEGKDGSPEADPIHGFKTIKEIYLHADPNYTGRFTVPVLFDKKADTIVNNESSEIIRMLYSSFDNLLPESLREVNRPGGGLYPSHLRTDIDAMNEWVYATINNGVYKTGFARTQEAYEENVRPLFASLDRLEAILSQHKKPFLFGDHVTEADIRLFTTLVRFDAAYVPVFLCNLKTIRHDYPFLYLWLRRLYWDRKTSGAVRGAFYVTTPTDLAVYRVNYAQARHRFVFGKDVPNIVPLGPEVAIGPLDE